MTEIVKMRREGLETVRKRWSGRMGSGVEGWGVVALPFQGVHLVLQQDKLHSDKNMTKQAFAKESDFRLLGTGYINTDKPSPGTRVLLHKS